MAPKVIQLNNLFRHKARLQLLAYLGSALFEQGEVMQRFLACWQSHFGSSEPSSTDPTVEQLLEGSGLVAARFDKYCSALHKRLLDFFSGRSFSLPKSFRLSMRSGSGGRGFHYRSPRTRLSLSRRGGIVGRWLLSRL